MSNELEPIVVGASLYRRLSAQAPVSKKDRADLNEAILDTRSVRRGEAVRREGDRDGDVYVFVSGWGCRYAIVPDGGRQITAFMLPGDSVMTTWQPYRGEPCVVALGEAVVAVIPSLTLKRLMASPDMAEAWRRCGQVDIRVLQNWITGIGRRDAYGRIAHLLCELFERVQIAGVASGPTFDLPLNQEDLADATGLTSVHVNRVLRRLREDGLARVSANRVEILDFALLARAAGYDGGYLRGGCR